MKTDTLALVQLLSNNMADPVTIDGYYNDVMYELGAENWFCDANIIPLTKGQLEVNLRAALGPSLVNRLGLIYDDNQLEEVTLLQMRALDNQWRDRTGYPRSYVREDEAADTIALHPAPFVASNSSLYLYGEPLGLDYPTYNLLVFYSYAALEPQEPWGYLELAVALRILAREFMRESDHTDQEFAKAAQTLATLCKEALNGSGTQTG